MVEMFNKQDVARFREYYALPLQMFWEPYAGFDLMGFVAKYYPSLYRVEISLQEMIINDKGKDCADFIESLLEKPIHKSVLRNQDLIDVTGMAEYEIDTLPEPVLREGLIYFPFALHKSDHGWLVDFLPTGQHVGNPFRLKKNAMGFINALREKYSVDELNKEDVVIVTGKP